MSFVPDGATIMFSLQEKSLQCDPPFLPIYFSSGEKGNQQYYYPKNNQWPSMTTNDHQWLLMTISDNQWQQMTINDHFNGYKNTTGTNPRRIDPRSLDGCRSSRFASGYCYYDWPLPPVPFGPFFLVSNPVPLVRLSVDLAFRSSALWPPVISRAAFRRCLIWTPPRYLPPCGFRCPGRTLALPPPCGLSVVAALLARASLLSLTWWNKFTAKQGPQSTLFLYLYSQVNHRVY